MSYKTLIISNIIADILLYIVDLFLGIFVFKFNKSFYYSTLFFTMGLSFLNCGFILLGFLKVKGYDIKAFTLATHASYLIIAVAAYYFIRNLDYYDEYPYLYWIIPIILIIFFIIFFQILNKKEHDKNKDKPIFKANV